MTPERISELRAKCTDSKWESEHNGVMIVRWNDLNQLLDAAEACRAAQDQAKRCLEALDKIRSVVRLCDPEFRVQEAERIFSALTPSTQGEAR